MANELVKYPASLTAREIAAYETHKLSKEPGISVDTRLRFFELFLAGNSCDEIKRLNPGFSLGAIVKCRVDEGWDLKREEYLENLYGTVKEKVATTTIESAHLISDLLHATNKYYKDKIKRYIQTGNVEDLPIRVDSVKGYKELFELLKIITGQDQNRKVSGEIVHKVEKDVEEAGGIKPEHLGRVLEMLEKHRQ